MSLSDASNWLGFLFIVAVICLGFSVAYGIAFAPFVFDENRKPNFYRLVFDCVVGTGIVALAAICLIALTVQKP